MTPYRVFVSKEGGPKSILISRYRKLKGTSTTVLEIIQVDMPPNAIYNHEFHEINAARLLAYKKHFKGNQVAEYVWKNPLDDVGYKLTRLDGTVVKTRVATKEKMEYWAMEDFLKREGLRPISVL